MKTGLRSLLITASLFLIQLQLNAQCTISNIYIQNVVVVGSTATTCTVKFDASFNLQNNNGNKYIFIHAWVQQSYPNYFNCVNGHPTGPRSNHAPQASDLVNSFVNIGINNNLPNPVFLTTYPPDPSVPLTTGNSITRTVAADGSANFIIYGVTVTVPVPCGTPTVIMADLWSSQSAHAQIAHCVNCGILYPAGYLSLTGFANCALLIYQATIMNNTNIAIDGFYRVYADVNGDGYFNPLIDTLIRDTTTFHVNAGPGTTTPISGPIPPANRNQDLFILLTITSGQASGASDVILIPSTVCAPLPVTFESFNARRINRTNVELRWVTATEINNSGFSIMRSVGGNWEIMGFVPSQAINGNSSSQLVYTYSDMNTYKGISQYRIRQVDLDGKVKYSDIRAVRGESQQDKVTVYPNPSSTGNVSVVFDNRNGTREVTLIDNFGRELRSWKSVSSNTLQIDNLSIGIYTLRIIVKETGDRSVEKFVIVK